MVFSSAIFIFGFLPILFLFYFLCPKKLKNYVLLFFSLLFYAFGGLKYLLIMALVVFADYIGALLISKYKRHKNCFLILTISINILVLIFYKYTNFFLTNINNLFNIDIPILDIIMPIGISFYTFQAMSYVIDVYKGEVKVQNNYFLLLLYVSLFPQLIAGPIVRYQTIEKEITKRNVSYDDISYGLERFILGLAKKLIIANQMGKLADIAFSGNFSCTVSWLGAIAYMFQIYFDFSAYSDMAIGLGRIFGFHFLENFNFPYMAKSITDFWRRWHISLSTWFRDYIYIPLGGNRKGIKRQIINMSVVWLLTGFWHGASWNFIMWGLYYLIFLILEKFVLKNILKKTPDLLKHIYALLIILIGWVLFRVENMSQFFDIIKTMFSFDLNSTSLMEARIYLETYYVYFILAILFSTNVYYVICDKFKNKKVFEIIKYIFLIVLFVISIMFLAQSSYNPFIYFRF